jgi:hypothetical protein
VLVLVLENPDRFAIRLTEQISSIGLFTVTESQAPRTSTTTRTIPSFGIWTNSEGQVKYCRRTFFGHATPDRAGARPLSIRNVL